MNPAIRLLFRCLCGSVLTLLLLPAHAQGSLQLTFNKTDFTLTTLGGTFDLTGTIFAPTSNTSSQSVDAISLFEIPPAGKSELLGGPLSDDQTPFLASTQMNPFAAGSTNSGLLIDRFTLDTSSISNPATIAGDYNYTAILQQNGEDLGPGQAFTLHIINSQVVATPEFGSVVSLGGLLAAGIAGLWLKKRRRAFRPAKPA